MTLSTIPSSLSSAFDALDDDLRLPVEMLLSDSRDDRLVAVVNLQHLCDEESVPFLIHFIKSSSLISSPFK